MTERLTNQPLYPARIDASDSIGSKARFVLIGSVPSELCNAAEPGGTIGATVATPGGTGYVLPSSGTTWAKQIVDLDPYLSGSFSVIWNGVLRDDTVQTFLRSSGGYGWNLITSGWSPGAIRFGLMADWNGGGFVSGALALTDNTLHSVGIVYDSVAGAVEIFFDGASVSAGAWGPDPGAMGSGQTFYAIGHATKPHKMLTVQAYAGKLTRDEIATLAANPWHIFEPEHDDGVVLAVVSGAAAELAGVAQATVIAAAALTTQIRLAGAAQSQVAASGALTAQIRLAADAVSISAAAGTLTAQIRLSGAALSQSISTAALSSGINLSAAAVADASADGMLDTIIRLIGSATASSSASGNLSAGGSGALEVSAQAVATASADLTTEIRFDGAALAQAIASAALSTHIQLGGNAQSIASANGSITTGDQLLGQAIAQAIATGELTTQIRLSAAAIAGAIASGSLTVPIELFGSAIAHAVASATLDAGINLAGFAVSNASASGVLTVGSLYQQARLATRHKLAGARLSDSVRPTTRLTTGVRHV